MRVSIQRYGDREGRCGNAGLPRQPYDMDVNCVREKKLTNMRASGTDESERLIPPKKLNMEGALEFCREDECVEVTPAVVRIRKVVLDGNERARTTARAKKANQNV